jgi:hypothetical protein
MAASSVQFRVRGFAGGRHPNHIRVGTLLLETTHSSESSASAEIEAWKTRMNRGEVSHAELIDSRIGGWLTNLNIQPYTEIPWSWTSQSPSTVEQPNRRLPWSSPMADNVVPPRPLEVLAKRGFLIDPRPEEITAFDAGSEVLKFTVGLKLITHTRGGLKIIPGHYVVFAIMTDKGEEFIDLPPHMVRRDLIPRLQEMCDAAEKLDEPRENANGR